MPFIPRLKSLGFSGMMDKREIKGHSIWGKGGKVK
jgi:hypothetical protein